MLSCSGTAVAAGAEKLKAGTVVLPEPEMELNRATYWNGQRQY
jgi:hypothetical protein